jgi:hypothetical protein
VILFFVAQLNNILNHCFFNKDYFTIIPTVRLQVDFPDGASLNFKVYNLDVCI